MTPRPRIKSPRSVLANLRLTPEERTEIEHVAYRIGIASLSAYFRHLHREQVSRLNDADGTKKVINTNRPLRQYQRTEFGTVFLGDSIKLLHDTLAPESVDLIITSPPFGLVRKKTYGNEDADEYVEWFRPFAEGFRRVLKKSGSLV